MPPVVARPVREKVTEGRAGIRRDSVIDNVCKHALYQVGIHQKCMLSINTFGRLEDTYKAEVEEEDRKKGKASAKKPR